MNKLFYCMITEKNPKFILMTSYPIFQQQYLVKVNNAFALYFLLKTMSTDTH